MLRFVTPHVRVDSVRDLSLQLLGSLRLEALLLDVDCTLKRYGDQQVTAEVAAWLDGLRAGGIGLCLVSNGRGRRIRRIAEKLGLPYVAKALKPLPFACRRAVRELDFPPERTAMVGDQLFADVMAARFAGLRSILVNPIHPEEEPWFTRLKRPPERLLLRWMKTDRPARGPATEI